VFQPGKLSPSRLERTVESLGFALQFRSTRNHRAFSNSLRSAEAEHKRNQTGSGLYHPIVKERILPGRLEELQTIANCTEISADSQAFLLHIKLILVERPFIGLSSPRGPVRKHIPTALMHIAPAIA
jgi:hypothetical protein